MTVVFHRLAERELIAAAKSYETRAPGLGADFIRQVERTLSEIVANPDAGTPVRRKQDQASAAPEVSIRSRVPARYREHFGNCRYASAPPPRLLENATPQMLFA